MAAPSFFSSIEDGVAYLREKMTVRAELKYTVGTLAPSAGWVQELFARVDAMNRTMIQESDDTEFSWKAKSIAVVFALSIVVILSCSSSDQDQRARTGSKTAKVAAFGAAARALRRM